MKSQKDRGWADFVLEFVLIASLFVLVFVVVCPRLSPPNRENAFLVAAGTDISNISAALQNFSLDCGRFPTTAEGLQALMVQPAGLSGWKGPYLEKGVPIDAFGNPYVYRCPGEHNKSTFDLWSFGPDGNEGGGDDIDNWTNK
jgi:general secretion pathway protein G